VSILSDSVAEVYELSKHDMLRKLPKRVLSALFTIEKELLPGDRQLRDMNRQFMRWDAYKKGVLAECGPGAADSSSERSSFLGVRRVRAVAAADIARNLEFLGLNASSEASRAVLAPTGSRFRQGNGRIRAVALTDREEEYFSDAPADFIRSLRKARHDKGLRMAFKKRGEKAAGLPEDSDEDTDEDDEDPMSIMLDKHWLKLRDDPISMALDSALSEDATAGMLPQLVNPRSSFTGAQAVQATHHQRARVQRHGVMLVEVRCSLPSSRPQQLSYHSQQLRRLRVIARR
jgi:hypothetical protein